MGIVNRFVSENKLNEGLDSKIASPETAEVGQIIAVKAVDENGKPTEFEAVEMPSGDEWELIVDVALEEEINIFEATEDMNGNPFLLKKIYTFIESEVPANTENAVTYMNTFPNGKGCLTNVINNNTDSKRYYWSYVEIIKNATMIGHHSITTANFNWSDDHIRTLYSPLAYNGNLPDASKVVIKANDGNRIIGGVGSKIKIWGIKA